MKLYAPLSVAAEKLRLLFQRRIQDADLAYLGDGHGRIDIPDMKGYVYARFAEGADNNGNTLYSTPFAVRSAGVAYINAEGTGVYVAYGRNNELQIVESHFATMDQAGFDTRVLNPLNQQSRFVYLWQITIGKCSAVATTITDSYLVTVKNFLHYVNNRFQFFETPLQADKLDLSAHNPATDQHRYVAVWVDTYGNVAEVTASTSQSLFTPLDVTDIQELVVSRPPDAIPHQAFYLANNQGTVTQQPAADVDLRQFLNMPQIIGFQSPVSYRERIQPDRQQLFGGALRVTGSLQVLGLLHGIPAPAAGGQGGIGTVTSVSATATPTSVFDIAVTNPTTTPAIALSMDNQSANTALAGPTSGGAATPAFRALVDADIPSSLSGKTLVTPTIADFTNAQHDHLDADDGGTLSASAIASGQLALARGGTHADLSATGGANQFLKQSSAGADITVGALADADVPNILTLTEIDDTNGNEQIKFVTTASAVNELTITNAAANTNPKIEPTGSDTNIGIDIIPKGTDPVNLDGAVVINESGADRDFRVESDGNANMLVVDASADSIGIGTNTPSSKTLLHVVSTTRASVPAPDMSTTQRDAIAAPFAGMMVYVNDQADFSWYNANELDWSNFYIPRYSQFQHPFWEHTVVSGNNPIWVSDTTQSGAGYWRQSAAALNDELSYSVALPAGTYHVEAMTTKGGGSGIMTIKWNGNTVSTHDLYNATAVVNFRVVSSSFNVLIPGVYAFGIKAASKNAASSGYLLSVSWYQFIRTANYP